ncbi:hypothetical protein V2J09_007250 [Rumex salicifolius]
MAMENQRRSNAGVFFLATLILWVVSVVFEIGFHRQRELLVVFGGCFFFQFANWVFRNWVSNDPLFVNTSVSLIHSSITSFAVVFILIKQWKVAENTSQMFEHEQLVGSAWPAAYTALSFSCGYFAYDQWDMLQYHLYSGWFPSILAHHLILLLCFTLALYRNVTINYLILTLICELHSVFLHIRKLRRMRGIRDAKAGIVKVEWALNWVTFALARMIPHVLITVKLLRDASKFKNGIELPLALFGMVGMNMINVGLGVDLLAAFKREIKQPVSIHVD